MRFASRSLRKASSISDRLAATRRSASGWIGMPVVRPSSNRRRMLTGSLSKAASSAKSRRPFLMP